MTSAATLPAEAVPPDTAASPTPAPTPSATSTPTPEPAATQPKEVVGGSDDIVRDVSEKSETLGSMLQYLDDAALETATFRISVLDALVVVGVILLVITAAWLAMRFARSLIKRATRFDNTQQVLAEKLVTILIWGAAFFIGIDLLGIDLTALAFFGGAFGLAIGFGLQKTFGNLIAGIILLLDKSIKPGDVIAVADTAGNETFGQIRKIGIRAVSVTTRDQREYLIPNENLMINQVENWSYSSKQVRMQVPVGVSYNSDMKLARDLMLQAARASERVLDTPPPTVWMTNFGESSVDFTIHCWIDDPEEGVGNVRSEVMTALWWLFKDNGIEIPYPQRDINLRGSEQMQALIDAVAGARLKPD